MKLAIFRRNFGNYSETFVKENVQRVNDGRTVIVCHDVVGDCDWNGDRPILVLGKYPVKLRVIILSIFLKRHNVKGCLIEFMDYAVKYRTVFERMKVPYVVLAHGYDIGRSLHRVKGYAEEVAKLKSALKVVVPCSYAKKLILQKTKLGSSNIHVVPVGIDLSKFESSNVEKDKNKAVFVGRFVEKKFPILMLYSFYLAWQKRPEIRLVCIGDGPLAPAAQDFCRVMRFESAVEFKGVRDSKFVRNEIDSARVLIQHSGTAGNRDIETMPLSAQEALSLGTPAVVSDHSGLPEIVDHDKNGFVVKEGNFDAMSERILEMFLMDEARYSSFQDACLRKKPTFSLNHRLEYINNLFAENG